MIETTDQANRLDEIVISKEFDINAALSAIQFYYNLARHRGETIVVEIWRQKNDPKEEGG
ncbi:MAG: hypothetical protein [Siphoviridae sp. cttb18]|nr:MAG: hypothetical protein [Siphoviridae sp. cttb18]